MPTERIHGKDVMAALANRFDPYHANRELPKIIADELGISRKRLQDAWPAMLNEAQNVLRSPENLGRHQGTWVPADFAKSGVSMIYFPDRTIDPLESHSHRA